MSRNVTHDGRSLLRIRFPYDRELVDRVKGLPGRRWNAADRVWTVPDTEAVALVELLEPERFGFDETTRELYRRQGGERTLEASPAERAPGLFDDPAPDRPTTAAEDSETGQWTVSDLNDRVRGLLRGAFPEPVWVVGEISGFNKSAHRKHVSFELVERDESGKTLSRLGAILFASSRQAIESALARAGDPFRLEDEIEVRLRLRIDLYVPWGQYRAVVEELDLRYTLGEAARRREQIVARLAEQGRLDRNTALPFPELPLRVGLITSLGSDACNDVMRTLQESGYAFDLTVHGARVQGRSTEPSVLNALDWFRERREGFDVLMICRGGGSRTDLIGFDSEPLGRAVADFPLPVVVGIGHEQDQSVLDAVGWSCKTPTAAAARLVEQVLGSERRWVDRLRELVSAAGRIGLSARGRHLERLARLGRATRTLLGRERKGLDHRRQRTAQAARASLRAARVEWARGSIRLPDLARRLLQGERERLARAARGLEQGARRENGAAAERLQRSRTALGTAALRALIREAERIADRERRLRLGDPRRVIERGYAILRRDGGAVITDPGQAPAGTRLTAELRGGSLSVRAEEKAEEKGD